MRMHRRQITRKPTERVDTHTHQTQPPSEYNGLRLCVWTPWAFVGVPPLICHQRHTHVSAHTHQAGSFTQQQDVCDAPACPLTCCDTDQNTSQSFFVSVEAHKKNEGKKTNNICRIKTLFTGGGGAIISLLTPPFYCQLSVRLNCKVN